MFPGKNCLICIAIFFFQIVSAKESAVTFVLLNSATGQSISSYEVMLQSVNQLRTITSKSSVLQPLYLEGIWLEEGTWQASVLAPGFASMTSHITVLPNTSPRIEFHLDPITLPAELQTVSFRSPDATLIVGFVVDEKTHQPLPGVTVRTNGREIKTDAAGFYRIYLPLASNTITPRLEFHRAGFQSEIRDNIETWSNGDWIYNISLKQGMGLNRIDVSKAALERNGSGTCETCDSKSSADNFVSSVIMPASIRVGRNCTGTSCTTVQVYSVQTYTKYVLPAEWYSCWGSLSNGMNSLMAGAVSIRSYGLWYVYHPLTSTYDICDNTTCQVFGTVQSTNANNAVDATDRYIMTDFGLANVMRAEYSAENNNKGCGDGYTGTGTSWPCISDMVCQGQTPNGHGRGVCQWGTIRWANGTRVTTASPCSQGVSHGLGTLTWEQILSHYYPSYTLAQGGGATIQSATPNPATVAQGSTFSIEYTVNTTDEMSLILSAAIAPTGTTTYTSDPAHDTKFSFFAGTTVVSRSFSVPSGQATGSYDLLVSAWYDKNNNNTIDAGDFVVNSQQYNSVLTVSTLSVQLVSFTATIMNNRDVRLDWRTISEISNYGFYVQRSPLTSGGFEDVANGFVAGYGTTNEPHDYSFVEQNVPGGAWRYRLRQVDLDGSQRFTDPIQVNIVTGVTETTPATFRLYQNYPNPFNPSTEIRFSVGTHGHTSLRVFDLLGREVATLFDGPAEPGRTYSTKLNGESLSSGVYVYKLSSGSQSDMKRLVLVR